MSKAITNAEREVVQAARDYYEAVCSLHAIEATRDVFARSPDPAVAMGAECHYSSSASDLLRSSADLVLAVRALIEKDLTAATKEK